MEEGVCTRVLVGCWTMPFDVGDSAILVIIAKAHLACVRALAAIVI